MELIDIRNKDGSITGEVKEREKIHADGDLHGTSHVWIVRTNQKGSFDVLLQQRSSDKDSFPECFDISSAGHIPAGQGYLESAIREIHEELGLNVDKSELKFVGMHDGSVKTAFYGKTFANHELSAVYLYHKDIDVKKLKLQKKEVKSVKWMAYEDCLTEIRKGNQEYCIFEDEFVMLKEAAPMFLKNYAKKKCSVCSSCGGCQHQGIDYQQQLKQKLSDVQHLFKGIGTVSDIYGMKDPYNYRNKVHAVIGEDRSHNVISGTYKSGTHFIVPVEYCMLEDMKADMIMATMRKLFRAFKVRPYNEDKRYGNIRHVLIRRGFLSNQIMVVLVTADKIFPSKNNFVKELLKVHPDITTVVQNINPKSTSMVLGDKENIWYGKGYIEDILCGKKFRISARSFYQINSLQTETLYNTAIDMAGLTGKETVIDAYCGIGTIGITAAGNAGKVIGVELNQDAVKDAVQNAKLNNIRNVTFHQGDAGKFMECMKEQADVVFLDPPRSGSTKEFISSVARIKAKKVVYISCDPTTQVRDLRIFKQKGYEVKRCVAVDMFPYTGHCEVCCLLTKGQ